MPPKRPVHPSISHSVPAEITDRIPLEIIFLIISMIFPDRKTLATCGLVNRDWLTGSRPHLFSDVDLHRQNYDDFISFLQSPRSTIAPSFVRRLTISQATKKTDGGLAWFSLGLPRLTGLSVKELRIINLRAVDYINPPELGTPETQELRLLRALETNFQSVTHLEILFSWRDTFPQYTQVLSLFSHLVSVKLKGIGWYGYDSEDEPGHYKHSRQYLIPSDVRVFATELGTETETAWFTTWLADHDTLPPMHTVSLNSKNHNPTPFPERGFDFLNKIGDSLRHLTVSVFLEIRRGDGHASGSYFEKNSRLQTLTILGVDLRASHRNFWGFLRMMELLGTDSVERVTVELKFDGAEQLQHLDWGRLDRALERTQFSRLQRIHFQVVEARKEAGQIIRRGLPKTVERRILRVSQPVDGFGYRADR